MRLVVEMGRLGNWLMIDLAASSFVKRDDVKADGIMHPSEGLRHRCYPGDWDAEKSSNTRGVSSLMEPEPVRNTFGVLHSFQCMFQGTTCGATLRYGAKALWAFHSS